jgi:uncharacterized phage protein gp47/JayE
MPFDRPTLAELIDRTREDLKTRLSLNVAVKRRRAADAVANTTAGAVHGLYGNLDFLSLQLFAATAEGEFLLRRASVYKVTPIAATFAEGIMRFTGTNGSAIPMGTLLVRDDQLEYEVLTGGVIAGGVFDTDVRATTAGEDGNLDDLETVETKVALPGVNSTVTVVTAVSGGNDEEDIEELRIRFIEELRNPPAGGRDSDYVKWAKLVAGVTRVWVYRHENGLGTVVVRFVRDNDTPSIIPDAGEIAAVQTSIDERRPTTAEVTVLAPVDVPLLYTLEIDPDTPENRTAVEQSLDDLHVRDAEAGDGVGRGTILLSQVQTSIGNSGTITNFTVTAPAADTVPALGDLLTRGTVTWT